jgi:Ca-dependent carbohydrate-binding module xylan-binding
MAQLTNDLLTDSVASRSTDISIGSGPDELILKISQDEYQGDAEYVISVDGVQIGSTLTAHASHMTGQYDTVTVLGDWGMGNHVVSVEFLNDAYGGAGLDRNLYVDSAVHNGVPVPDANLQLYWNGAVSFSFAATIDKALQYEGIVLNGGEFNSDPRPEYWSSGVLGWNYIYPSTQEIDYFLSKGMNTFKIALHTPNIMGDGNADDIEAVTILVGRLPSDLV